MHTTSCFLGIICFINSESNHLI